MTNPIEIMIASAPTPARVLPPEPSAGYDPRNADSPPPAEVPSPLVDCFFSNVVQEGLAGVCEATATFRLQDIPAESKAEILRVEILDVAYNVVRLRKRIWEGAPAGWTLLLKR